MSDSDFLKSELVDGTHLVLLSGGLDSAAAVAHVRDSGFRASGLFVDYGQPSSEQERRSARLIASHFDIDLIEISAVKLSPPSGEILGRNAFLVFLAAVQMGRGPGVIYLGIHSGTTYFDCSEEFVDLINQVLAGYADGRVTANAPFLKWTKHDIHAYSKDQGVPAALTWSCEVQNDRPCGRCLSCRDRLALDASP